MVPDYVQLGSYLSFGGGVTNTQSSKMVCQSHSLVLLYGLAFAPYGWACCNTISVSNAVDSSTAAWTSFATGCPLVLCFSAFGSTRERL
jgi:hypothetical protein